MNDTMTEETTAPPKRVRPPRTKPATVNESLTVDDMIPAPPDADPKSLEMMDWIYTYLPNEMARNFYGGRNHTPRP